MKLPKCFWITSLGNCTYGLDEGHKCKGICTWYLKKNSKVSLDYPDNTYNDTEFKGTREEDYE